MARTTIATWQWTWLLALGTVLCMHSLHSMCVGKSEPLPLLFLSALIQLFFLGYVNNYGASIGSNEPEDIGNRFRDVCHQWLEEATLQFNASYFQQRLPIPTLGPA